MIQDDYWSMVEAGEPHVTIHTGHLDANLPTRYDDNRSPDSNKKKHILKTYNCHYRVCSTETIFSMMTPPTSFHAPFCWMRIERVQRASEHGLESKAGPRRPFKFSNCALAHLTRSICIQWYSVTKLNRGVALTCYSLRDADSLMRNVRL